MTPKKKRFKDEYLVDLNATQAAIRAGYSEKTAYSQGQRLLKDVEIRTAINEALKERSKRLELDTDTVIENLREIADRCMQHAPVLDRKGEQVYVETPNGEEAPAYTFNAMGAARALEMIGRHFGMFQGQRFLNFDFPEMNNATDMTAAINAVLSAAGKGELTLSEAREIVTMIEAQRRCAETQDLERRIAALESRGGS
jgi:phage terminase small subunit